MAEMYTPPTDVAVVITSHNYGRFLAEAIQSVLRQTHPAAEIVVVDDASRDNTPAVAQRYAHRGVKLVRGKWREVLFARRAGFEATRSPLLVFLDADDRLQPDYLQRGIELFSDRDVGVVYSDWRRFGDGEHCSDFPAEVTYGRLRQDNVAHSASIVRRDALQVARVFDRAPIAPFPADYHMWLRVAECGFKFRKQPAILEYRDHAGSMSKRDRISYYHGNGLAMDNVTIAIPLSGRLKIWPKMARWLQRQEWPREQTQLVLMDTSGDRRFGVTVRQWAATSDYPDVRVLQFSPEEPGLADLKRNAPGVPFRVNLAMCRIHARLQKCIDHPWMLMLEDDIFPPYDVVDRLMRNMHGDVASVSAPYISRVGNWISWDANNNRVEGKLTGVHEVTAAGFGCALMRSHVYRQHVFTPAPGEPWFDPSFYRVASTRGWRHLMDWDCEAEHDCERLVLEEV
jgi:GT2 family glycosyltransferase